MVSVTTVRGPVASDQLGTTMAHEHVVFDLSAYYQPPADDADAHRANYPVTPGLLPWLRNHPMNSRANLVQQDVEVSVTEIGQLGDAGATTVVDQTTIGIGPQPRALVEVSRRTGIHVVAGTGFYISGSYPARFAAMSTAALTDHLRRELLQGMGDTDIRAGLIGELGVSAPVLPFEQRLLSAAAVVQQEIGCAVSIHTAWGPDGVRQAAHAAQVAQLDPHRTALCHLDVRLRSNVELYVDLMRTGFFLSLDTFGRDCYYPHVGTALPPDSERVSTVMALLQAGAARHLLFSSDISFSHELAQHGGHGYAHVLRDIIPQLRSRGVGESALHAVLVDNPREWLAGSS